MTASEIIPRLFIGDAIDAQTWQGEILCVLESIPQTEPEKAHWIPVLVNGRAPRSQLDLIASEIDYNQNSEGSVKS